MKTKNTLYGIITAALLFTFFSKSNAAVNEISYTITINLKEITTLVPVAGATIVLNSETKLTDSTGKAVFVVPGTCAGCVVKYYYTVNKYGYIKINDSISLKADKPVTIIMKPITYNVVFEVSDGLKPITGAWVDFNSQTIMVNSQGLAAFFGVKMGAILPYTIYKDQYKTVTGTITGADNITRTFYITPEGTNIIYFFVKRVGDTAALAGSDIIFNNDTIPTDANGRAIFSNVETGSTKSFSVFKDGFSEATGSIAIDTDLIKTVLIDSLQVNFLVTDGINYIKDADVSFISKMTKTNDTGVAVFRGITGTKGMTYEVNKKGYNTFTGSVDVDKNNVTVTVILIIKNITLPEGIAERKAPEITVYPNPVRGDLYISSSETIKSLQILSILGQTVKTINNPSGNTIQITTEDMRTGMYLIRVVDGNNRTSVFRIVKE